MHLFAVNARLVGTVLVVTLLTTPAAAIGALAASPDGSGWGSSWGYTSRSAAGQSAISACRGTCRVVLTFSGGCGAYAIGGSAKATGKGGTKGAAENAAMKACRAKGGNSCRVLVSACDR